MNVSKGESGGSIKAAATTRAKSQWKYAKVTLVKRALRVLTFIFCAFKLEETFCSSFQVHLLGTIIDFFVCFCAFYICTMANHTNN